MADEAVTPSAPAEAPATATADVVPLNEVTDFREYVRRRTTGEPVPEKTEEAPAAAEVEAPQAKTVPDSETAEDQEPEEEETDEESEAEPAPKRPGGRQRRIDRLTRENEEFKRRLAEIEQREKPPPSKEKAAAAEGEPQLEQFETLQDYQRALAKHFFEQARAEEEKTRAVARVQEAWDGKEKAARKAHTDYDDVINSFKVPQGPGVMAARHAMLEDPHGAEILYYLGKHKGDVARIASLDPINAVREIGRLSVMFDSASSVSETAKRITSAPKPPPPVGRPAKTSSDSIYDEEVAKDYPRWEKARQAQLRNS